MSFIGFNQDNYFEKDNKPFVVFGINYMASYICGNFWDDWRPEIIRSDLKKIKDLGLNVIRFPMFWEFNEPEPGKYNDLIFERFDIFLDFAKEYDLYLMPWFLVGVAAGTFDVSYRNGRSIFSNEMIELEKAHLTQFIKGYKDEEAIFAWDISDEPYWMAAVFDGFDKAFPSRERAFYWVKELYNAIKNMDLNHLVTLGFDSTPIQRDTGFRIEDVAKVLDFTSSTTYSPYLDEESVSGLKSTYFSTFCAKFHLAARKPFLFSEAPGGSTNVVSEQALADNFRLSIHSAIANGACGVMPWVFKDFIPEIRTKWPLDNCPGSVAFGILKSDNSEKLTAKELKSISNIYKSIDFFEYNTKQSGVCILVSEKYYEGLKNNNTLGRTLGAYILASEAHLDADLIYHIADIVSYKLVIIPSEHFVSGTEWLEIKDYVNNGGNVLYSYGGKSLKSSLSVTFQEVFGLEVLCHQFLESGECEVRLVDDFFSIKKGASFAFRCDACYELESTTGDILYTIDNRQALSVMPKTATIIAVDGQNNPCVFLNSFGKGNACFINFPLEGSFMDKKAAAFIEQNVYQLYAALAELAGVKVKYQCNSPLIELKLLFHKAKNQYLLFALNHASQNCNANIVFDYKLKKIYNLIDEKEMNFSISGQKTEIKYDFNPFEAAIFKMEK